MIITVSAVRRTMLCSTFAPAKFRSQCATSPLSARIHFVLISFSHKYGKYVRHTDFLQHSFHHNNIIYYFPTHPAIHSGNRLAGQPSCQWLIIINYCLFRAEFLCALFVLLILPRHGVHYNTAVQQEQQQQQPLSSQQLMEFSQPRYVQFAPQRMRIWQRLWVCRCQTCHRKY